MCSSLVLFLALAANVSQNGELTIARERLTYGYLGPAREDSNFLPGDVVFMSLDLENVKWDANGKASLGLGMEIVDAAGKRIYRQIPQSFPAQNFLGGNGIRCAAHVAIPVEQSPGDYAIGVTVEDRAAKTSKTSLHKIRVLPPAFGLVQVNLSADRQGKVPRAAAGSAGEILYINFALVGFQRDATKKPNVELSMRVLDDKGKPTVAHPLTGKVDRNVPMELKTIPLQFDLTLNNPGRYTVELAASDKLSGTSSRIAFRIQVFPLD
jgi:hypothetical protein